MEIFYKYENIFQDKLNATSLNDEDKIKIMNIMKIYLQIRDPVTNISMIKSLPKCFVISKICEKLNKPL